MGCGNGRALAIATPARLLVLPLAPAAALGEPRPDDTLGIAPGCSQWSDCPWTRTLSSPCTVRLERLRGLTMTPA